jgi:hypothetical protein
MSSRNSKLHAAMAVGLALFGNDIPDWMANRRNRSINLHGNQPSKCAYVSCSKPANGNKLYCSPECCKFDRELHKK